MKYTLFSTLLFVFFFGQDIYGDNIPVQGSWNPSGLRSGGPAPITLTIEEDKSLFVNIEMTKIVRLMRMI